MASAGTRAGVLALAGVFGSGFVLQIVDSTVGLPDGWTSVATFVLLAGFGFVLPQLYLLRVDDTVPASYRRGFLLVVVVLFGAAAADTASPPAATVTRSLVGLAVAAILLAEARKGYRSVADSGSPE
ncbi:hypothetical protein GRX03_08350 [Halovenus sp. WSH3]|uniref:Uncharacterized protein n=1 Tax=Halovenus carboxidivorans TaxID=2692199 RepID=A0A6B0T8H1_9EURY|nr:hypothetical protein [Halovenus carboxidivorans]MXR51612.1 hypothetical protein [Halovenus carboxidivorans]